jgi:membrane protein
MVRRWLADILRWGPVHRFIGFLKVLRLPGFEGLPAYDVLAFFIKGIQKGSLKTRASSVAFNFLLAVFPAIIFLFTLIAYIPVNGFQDLLLDMMSRLMPTEAYLTVKETVEDIIMRQRTGLLSIGFISALYFSTNGVNSLIDSFNATSHAVETRSPVLQQAVALAITVVLSLVLLVAIALTLTTQFGLSYLLEKGLLRDGIAVVAIESARWVIILLLMFVGISLLYFLGPAKRTEWRFLSAGSTLATVLTVITSLGFSYFVENFNSYNRLYGSIGTLIIVMLWMYYNALALIIGFELNASIEDAKLDMLARQERSLGLSLEDEIEHGGANT